MIGQQLIARVGSWLVRAAEGQYRPGPYYLPITGGWLPDGAPINWWQIGLSPAGGAPRSAMVEACISAYSQTVSMCPGAHWRSTNKGGRERITNSALSRILRRPNEYQSISDFMLNATRSLYLEGNAYALALRNDRFEIDELHLMDPYQSFPRVAVTGDVFYTLAGNDVIDRQAPKPLLVPARDVLHIRLHTDRKRPYPLKGDTPLTAALQDMATGDAITKQQINFYLNQARPSAVISTDLALTTAQIHDLRALWNEQARQLYDGTSGPGGVPILTHGLKVQPWNVAGKDAAVAEIMKLSDEKIALCFRVPGGILGIGGQTYASAELLMQAWISTGLGFALNHIEEAFGLLFQLRGQPDEYLEFDTAALLRSAFKDRIEGLARAVQGGILAPNEARALEGYDAVKDGDEPRLQAQVVPLSAAAAIPAAPATPAAPAAQSSDDEKPDDEPKEKPAKVLVFPARQLEDESRTIGSRATRFM